MRFEVLKEIGRRLQKQSNEKSKIPESVDFTLIRKYSQQLIINADKRGAKRAYYANKV